MLYVEICEWDFIAEDFNFVENMQMKHIALSDEDFTEDTYDGYQDPNGNANFIYEQDSMNTSFVAVEDEETQNYSVIHPEEQYSPINQGLIALKFSFNHTPFE